MNADMLGHLKGRLQTGPFARCELHQLAVILGTSTWSRDECARAALPDVVEVNDEWQLREESTSDDPLATALLRLAGPSPGAPAAALLARLPPGLIASAPALIEAAKNHPQLEVIGGSRKSIPLRNLNVDRRSALQT
ncbi:MAG: hypothetical protein U1F43_37190 [Myxococcota bacterium]